MMMPEPYRILLADDYVRFRQELRKLLHKTDKLKIVGEVGDGNGLFQFLEQEIPDLIMLDINMPPLRSTEVTRLIKLQHPKLKVLIMVMDHEAEYLIQARQVGADGVLLKQCVSAELFRAISTIRRGNFYLPVKFREKRSGITTPFELGPKVALDYLIAR
jgi:two-component system response regulator DegU